MFSQDYAQFSIFAGLDSNQISQLSPFMVDCQYEENSVIFEQGQAAQYLYVLLAGEVIIHYKPYDGPTLTVARIEPGGVFGWSAALRRDVYTSGAYAMQKSLAYRIRGDSLQTICKQHPETGGILLERLADVIAQRLRSTHTQVLSILTQGLDNSPKVSDKKASMR